MGKTIEIDTWWQDLMMQTAQNIVEEAHPGKSIWFQETKPPEIYSNSFELTWMDANTNKRTTTEVPLAAVLHKIMGISSQLVLKKG